MREVERRVARGVKAMTRREVMVKAMEGKLTWLSAAGILGITPRHMRRLRRSCEKGGFEGPWGYRGGRPRRKRIKAETIEELCRLRREKYADFSILHFWEKATEKHGLKIGYTWAKGVLQAAGLAEKAPGRGQYRRKRERRPMVGMLVHLDASTHRWVTGAPMQDLMVALDDADGRILYAKFVKQEGTLSTMETLWHVLSRYGRFSELYTDRGSHFCTTGKAGQEPTTQGQVSRALKALGIRQILARSPEARGRSERAFGTIQGRLPQELRSEGVRSYAEANRYLREVFVPDFNRRFTVRPRERQSAFVSVPTRDLDLILSVQEERVVRNDNTVTLDAVVMQLEPTRHRRHFARCPIFVHRFFDGTLGVTYQGRVIGRFDGNGAALPRDQRLAA